MPCFSNGPNPNEPEYDQWVSQVRPQLQAFTHVVDYYYRKAKLSLPHPGTVDNLRAWFDNDELPDDVVEPVDAEDNSRVLRQILLHLDCDGIGVFQLNDIRNLLIRERTPKNLGYLYALNHCFAAMRNYVC